MRKRYIGKKLSRYPSARRALLRSLVEALFTHESIRTTLPKARAVRSLAEKLITKAKIGNSASVNVIKSFLFKKETLRKLLTDIAPRFSKRAGGYLRIVKLGPRRSDFAEMVIMQLVEKPQNEKTLKPKKN